MACYLIISVLTTVHVLLVQALVSSVHCARTLALYPKIAAYILTYRISETCCREPNSKLDRHGNVQTTSNVIMYTRIHISS